MAKVRVHTTIITARSGGEILGFYTSGRKSENLDRLRREWYLPCAEPEDNIRTWDVMVNYIEDRRGVRVYRQESHPDVYVGHLRNSPFPYSTSSIPEAVLDLDARDLGILETALLRAPLENISSDFPGRTLIELRARCDELRQLIVG